MDTGLSGKAVLVTGGATGIGKAIAAAYAAEGARVAITYNDNREQAEAVAKWAIRMELEEPDSIAAAVAEAAERLGGLDVLIVNAVRYPRAMPDRLEDLPAEEVRAMLRSNLEGSFALCAAALPHLRAAGSGRIVFISSGVAEEGFPTFWGYATAKAGLYGLARTLSWDAGRDGVLVNLVGVGFTRTESSEQAFGAETFEKIARLLPQKRASDSEDVARLVLYLGSAANTSVTGELVREGTSTARTPLVVAEGLPSEDNVPS